MGSNKKKGKQRQKKSKERDTKNTAAKTSFKKKHSKFSNLPLRERMMEQLKSSRFRYINEEIYTMQGRDALKYFKKEPAAFDAYHAGYQKQLKQWPMDPLDNIISSIKSEFKKTAVIADFGCGAARLAKSLPGWQTHSFDLVALDPCVTVCDVASTPLPPTSVDIVVCCLSLMGTNLADYLKEANRVLKLGGTLKIAEVTSRFEDINAFVENLASFGFKKPKVNQSSNIFVFFDFKKEADLSKKGKKKLPVVTLKPCLYKKRYPSGHYIFHQQMGTMEMIGHMLAYCLLLLKSDAVFAWANRNSSCVKTTTTPKPIVSAESSDWYVDQQQLQELMAGYIPDVANNLNLTENVEPTIKVSNLKVVECNGADFSPLRVGKFEILEDQVILPGFLNAAFNFSSKIDVSAPIKLHVDAYRHVMGSFVRLPCYNKIGSCDYDNICELLPRPQEKCPEQFIRNGVPCTCAIRKGEYVANTFDIFLGAVDPENLPSWVDVGRYSAHLIFFHRGATLFCVDAEFSLNKINMK